MGEALIVASRNSKKLAELRELLSPRGYSLVSLRELDPQERLEIAETGRTFRENALIKARAAARAFESPAVGEDSGLSVVPLGGAPGVYSARFHRLTTAELRGLYNAYPGGVPLIADDLDPDRLNNVRLLAELEGSKDRRAFYTCALALVDAAGKALFTTRGEVHGRLGDRWSGSGGFGYDPLFHPEDSRLTYGELPPEAKRATSHRSRALRRFLAYLDEVRR
jgi:XTP/dITP diphosphohydrolase